MALFYKKFSFWVLIIVVGVLGFFFYKKYLTPIEVKGFSVKRQNLEVTVTGTSSGTVKSDVDVNITAQRTGKIIKLYVEEGDKVNTGELIAELDASEVQANLKKAEAELKQAEANLINIKLEYSRKEKLYREDLITQQELNDVTTRLSLADAELERAKSVRDIAQLQYDYSFIKSPVNGVVSERPVEVGDTVTPGPVIASIVDMNSLYISAPVDEADIGSISIGQPVKVTMDAYPGRVFNSRVIKISPIVTGARHEARTFEVRVSSPKEGGIVLKPGQSADVEIITGEAKDALVVPSHAVIDKGGEVIVYIDEGGKAKQKKVTVGIHNWNFTEIKEGPREGEKVIITPDKPGFKEGVRIKVVDLP